MNKDWQTEWPTENDTRWWFYGYRSEFSRKSLTLRHGKNTEPPTGIELLSVKVWNNGKSVFYVADGAFLYEAEGAIGLWQKVEISKPSSEQFLKHFMSVVKSK